MIGPPLIPRRHELGPGCGFLNRLRERFVNLPGGFKPLLRVLKPLVLFLTLLGAQGPHEQGVLAAVDRCLRFADGEQGLHAGEPDDADLLKSRLTGTGRVKRGHSECDCDHCYRGKCGQ